MDSNHEFELKKPAADLLKRSKQDGALVGGSIKAVPEIDRVNAKLEYYKVTEKIEENEKEHATEMKKADADRQTAAERLARFHEKFGEAMAAGGAGAGESRRVSPNAYVRHPDAYNGPNDPRPNPNGKPYVFRNSIGRVVLLFKAGAGLLMPPPGSSNFNRGTS